MAIEDKLKKLARQLPRLRDAHLDKDATKRFLVEPFISALGYDVANLHDVIPRYSIAYGTYSSLVREKVDYAIMRVGQPFILVESVPLGEPLAREAKERLYRYHARAHQARIGILTNGETYQVYADLATSGTMDPRPCVVFDLANPDPLGFDVLRLFVKGTCSPAKLRRDIQKLLDVQDMRNLLASEFEDPSEDFVRCLARKVHDGPLTAKRVAYFREIVLDVLRECGK